MVLDGCRPRPGCACSRSLLLRIQATGVRTIDRGDGRIDSVSLIEREVRDRQGRWFSLRIRPYKSLDNKIDGAVLALFPRNERIARRDLIECTMLLNHEVDWQELGFVCDGRFLFTQRSLQTCVLPEKFSRFLPPEAKKDAA